MNGVPFSFIPSIPFTPFVPLPLRCRLSPLRLAGRAVPFAAAGDDLPGFGLAVPAEDFGLLRLEELVGREKRLDLAQPVLAELLQAADVAEAWVADRDGQHLEVAALLVGHVQPADRQHLYQAAGERGFLDQDKDIEVVAVFDQCVRDKAVVGKLWNE